MNPDATEVVPWLTSAATIVFIQKWLKTTHLYATFVKAFPGSDKWAHRAVGAFGSIIAAAGIHYTWNWKFDEGGNLLLAIPGFWAILHGLSDWFRVYILQHTVYAATHEPPYQPPTA